MKAVKGPCPECPFSRRSQPGNLGGSPPEVFIGQARGPFALPCHMHLDYSNPEWKSTGMDVPQCAGAAVFRTHTDRDGRLPEAIPKLPADSEVFSDEYEFLAHHYRVSVDVIKTLVNEAFFEVWMRHEMSRARFVRLLKQNPELGGSGQEPTEEN